MQNVVLPVALVGALSLGACRPASSPEDAAPQEVDAPVDAPGRPAQDARDAPASRDAHAPDANMADLSQGDDGGSDAPDASSADLRATMDGRSVPADGALGADIRADAGGRVTVDDLAARSFKSPSTGLVLPYRLFVPRDYDAGKPHALLLFLHGAGERGSDNRRQVANGALAWVQPAAQAQRPTIVVFPQCPDNAQWVDTPWKLGSYSQANVQISRPASAVVELLAALRQEFNVDPRRILLTGLSMGGYGTWDLLVRKPDVFAGAVAVCGAGDPSRASLIKDIPIAAFHGALDKEVPPSGSREMVDALTSAGGAVMYKEYPGVGHNAWDYAYADPNVISWLLRQEKR